MTMAMQAFFHGGHFGGGAGLLVLVFLGGLFLVAVARR